MKNRWSIPSTKFYAIVTLLCGYGIYRLFVLGVKSPEHFSGLFFTLMTFFFFGFCASVWMLFSNLTTEHFVNTKLKGFGVVYKLPAFFSTQISKTDPLTRIYTGEETFFRHGADDYDVDLVGFDGGNIKFYIFQFKKDYVVKNFVVVWFPRAGTTYGLQAFCRNKPKKQ